MSEPSFFGMLFQEPRKLEFLDKPFDFQLNPDHFIKWLQAEGEDVVGDYRIDVGSMCEYACLYVAMMLHNIDLRGEFRILYGQFVGWSHYWLLYSVDGEDYFIDLTLKQFIDDAPKVAVTRPMDGSDGYRVFSDEGELLSDYIERQRAFVFYVDPNTIKD